LSLLFLQVAVEELINLWQSFLSQKEKQEKEKEDKQEKEKEDMAP